MIYSVTNQLSRKFGNLETGLFYWTQIGKKGWSSEKGIVIKLVYVFKSIDYAWPMAIGQFLSLMMLYLREIFKNENT